MGWYFMDDQDRVGPLEEQEFYELVSRGRVSDSTLVWKQGMPEWKPYSQATIAATPAPAVDTLDAGGAATATSDSLLAPMNDAAPMTSDRRAGWGAQSELAYAGFGVRLVAKLIDFGIIMAFMMFFAVGMAMFISAAAAGGPESGAGPIVIVVFLLWYAFCLFTPIAYNAHFVAKSGATPGKKAMGLKVVRANGKNVTTGQAWGRAFADLLSQMTMYIGYLLVVFDDEKCSLHDHICGTRVISGR